MGKALVFVSLLIGFSAHADAVFSGSTISCDGVAWMNLDGSYQCNNPLFKSNVSNGTTTLSVDAKVEAQATTAAAQTQGQGLCGYLGYANYVSETTDIADANELNVGVDGPYVSLDAKGNVTSMDKVTKKVLTSVICK